MVQRSLSTPDLQTLVDASSDGLLVVDQKGIVLYANSASSEIMGRSPEILIGEQLGIPIAAEEWTESRIMTPDGSLRTVEIKSRLVEWADSPAHVVTIRDITDRVRIERDLREADERLRVALKNADIVLAHTDRDLRYTWIHNPHPDFSDARSIGKRDDELLPPGQAEALIRIKQQAIESGVGQRAEFDVSLSDGVHTYDMTVELLESEHGEVVGLTTASVDITHMREAQRSLAEKELQLQQSQRLESVGRLAGGVAHDFNNLLGVIIGYTDIIQQVAGPENRWNGELEKIRAAADRAADLTAKLLAFSRKQRLEPRPLNISEVVQGIEEMLRRILVEDIELVIRLEEDLWTVLSDQGQIEQVLMNLVVNARDALPSGGTIIIETANVQLGERYDQADVQVRPGPYVQLSVSDTGTGISMEVLKQIFEPFFTTKEVGKGTGLGLSTVYGIVKQSGGYIWVYSEPGEGTSFKVQLPAVDRTAESLGSEPFAAEPAQGGSEHILVVEDEAALRDLVSEVLGENGYQVITACDVETALQILDGEQPVDLVISDVIMPGGSGQDLSLKIVVSRPGTPVLFMSGYTGETLAARGNGMADVPFIGKPFSIADLLTKVHQVLAKDAD